MEKKRNRKSLSSISPNQSMGREKSRHNLHLLSLNSPLSITILSAKGMERILQEEVEELFHDFSWSLPSNMGVGPGAVNFQGDWKNVVLFNLALRTASRVIINIARGRVFTLDEIYQMALQVPWEDMWEVKKTFAVNSSVSDSQIHHPLMVNLKIKDAIADRFRLKLGHRPNVDRDNPQIKIFAKIHQNVIEIGLDTSGKSLSHRGYRNKTQMAPLRESLAAALLRLGGWNQVVRSVFSKEGDITFFERVKENPVLSQERHETQDTLQDREVDIGKKRKIPPKLPLAPIFHDPMCGTGTFPIEAALILKGKFPSLSRRSFPFLYILPAQKESIDRIYKDIHSKLAAFERKDEEIQGRVREYLYKMNVEARNEQFVFGSDYSREAIEVAQLNANHAGVEGLINWKVANFYDLEKAGPRGIMMINPPYGHRMGEDKEELFNLYQKIGDISKKMLTGWMVWIMSANEGAMKRIGLRATRRYIVYNGPLKCRFNQYILF